MAVAITPFTTPNKIGKKRPLRTLATIFLTKWNEITVKNIEVKKSHGKLENKPIRILKKLFKLLSHLYNITCIFSNVYFISLS
jgi:hypothetical protein